MNEEVWGCGKRRVQQTSRVMVLPMTSTTRVCPWRSAGAAASTATENTVATAKAAAEKKQAAVAKSEAVTVAKAKAVTMAKAKAKAGAKVATIAGP